MYSLAIILQYIGIVAAMLGVLYLYPKKPSRQKTLLSGILTCVAINEIGYLFELQSTTMEAALVAIKVAYIGKLIAELGIFVFVLLYAGIELPKWLVGLLGALHLFVLSLIWNCENTPLYYSSIEYTQDGFYPHVILGHGVVYDLFTIVTFSYMAIILVICVVRFVRKNDYIERMRMVCLLTPPVTFVIGLMLFRAGVTQGYDTTAISYLVCALVFILTSLKFDLVNEKEIVEEFLLSEFSEAVMFLDEDGEIVYTNRQFEVLYPNYKDDASIKEEIVSHSREGAELAYQDKYYHVISKEITRESINIGCIYMLHDTTEAHMRMELVNNYNRNLQSDVEAKTRSIQEMQNGLVLGMANMVENRDVNTGGHIKRTSQVVKILVQEMQKDASLQMEASFCQNMIKAAPMHDLGKIAVDDDILRKPGKFTEEEYAVMKTHAAKGAEIVRELLESTDDREFARIAENVAHYHHERVDGTGYPNNLKGEEIPFEARIMAVADVYDALVSKRCYKDKLPFDKAFEIIEEGMGTQFDKKLEPYFVACREKLEAYYAENDEE